MGRLKSRSDRVTKELEIRRPNNHEDFGSDRGVCGTFSEQYLHGIMSIGNIAGNFVLPRVLVEAE